MIELNRNHSSSQVPSDLEQLQQRANNRRDQFKHTSGFARNLSASLATISASPTQWLKKLPSRYLIHTVVALTVPAALAFGQLAVSPVVQQPLTNQVTMGEFPISLAPLSVEDHNHDHSFTIPGDPPLAEEDALPVPLSLGSRSEVLAPLVVPATIAGDVVKMRNGPGLDYDEIGRLDGGTNVEVVGRHGEWLQVRQDPSQPVFWVATELVDLPEALVFNLNEVPSSDIPPPPPPKVGVVREESLNLRDGPGTNYVTMKKLDQGSELAIEQQYQDWLFVSAGDFAGWVKSEFLNIGPNVLTRVPVANEIPDPNPALVGVVQENKVNLRKGPGSAYARITSIDAGAQLDLLARHKDWYKVKLSDGSNAWIFSDLIRVSPMVRRRVAETNNIPALPVKATPKARATSSGGGGAPVNIPASGDVAGFAVNFVGYRYVWGGSSPSVGFDCSGLTSYVYRQFGVGLPHSAAAQFSTRYGAMISSLGSLAPGDLVFFAGTGGRRGISHVAIYIGGGQIVHAMTPRYGVQVSNVFSSYWQNHFAGAIRPYR